MSRLSSHSHHESPSSKEKRHIQSERKMIPQVSPAKRDVVKVAVEVKGVTQLYEMDQTKKLQDTIKDLCKGSEDWNDFALQLIDTNQYITEANQHDVRDGSLLRLVTAPGKAVADILRCLKDNGGNLDEKVTAYEKLCKASSDPTFADYFIKKKGLTFLIDVISNNDCKGEALAFALGAALELLDHNMVVYDQTLTSEFIKRIGCYARDSKEIDATTLQRSLAILEAAVINSQHLYNIVAQEITIMNLTNHLQRSNTEIQHNTLALINALFLRTPDDGSRIMGRRTISDPMAQKQFRTVVLNQVIRTSKTVSSEMAHQLYVLQVLTFNLLEERMMSKLNSQEKEQRDLLFELRNIAFDSSSETSPTSKRPTNFNSEDFKKLGFENHNNPILEFDMIPPGVFALDCMRYFARNQQDNYVKLVLENSAKGDKHECPFAKSSVYLVKMICEILKIGEQPTETGEEYYAMFFTHDHSIEEFYCTCIQLLNKTWKEMSAIRDDFDKVMSVVHDQVILALNTKPTSLDSFRQKLNDKNYHEILKIRQRKRLDKEQFDSQARPVVELQQELRPQIVDLVKEQRLNVLKSGTVFNKISNRKLREKSHWCCRLSPNHKFLYYCDVDNNTHKPPIEEMTNKLEIADVKEIFHGKNCPHVRNAKLHKNTAELSFSISYDPDDFLNFVAPDMEVCNMWLDGLNCLLGKEMMSEKASNDVDILLGMEMKLHLLDLESIHIPDQPPPIPKPPADFNFSFKL